MDVKIEGKAKHFYGEPDNFYALKDALKDKAIFSKI